MTVPGGLFGVKAPTWWSKEAQEWFNKQINEGLTGVTATAELVGNPGISRTNLLFQEGVALSLPIRLHLDNAILGSSCFVGSKSSPITLNLTTGTTAPPKPNKPITGAVGELEFLEEFQLVSSKATRLSTTHSRCLASKAAAVASRSSLTRWLKASSVCLRPLVTTQRSLKAACRTLRLKRSKTAKNNR